MAVSGRLMLIKIGGVAIAGARESGFTVDNSPIDITDLASGGERKLASFSGTRSFDLSVSGVWGDKVFRELAVGAAPLLTNCIMEFADGGKMEGDVFIANYAEPSTHDSEVTFTATLQSAGPWTYTTAV